MKRVLLWIKICRPQTLFAFVIPVLVTFLLTGFERPAAGITTVLCALSLQILSNLINDYYDFRRGADKAGRVGFKRALSEGEVTESQMRLACILATGAACILGLYLVLVSGWGILAIGLTALTAGHFAAIHLILPIHIAILAPGTDLGTTVPRIPVCLYFPVLGHSLTT